MPKSNLDEEKFQKEIKNTEWYKEFVKEFGEEPDLNTKDYDYRKAWAAGIRPERDPYDKNRYHWGSSDPKTGEMLKSEDHPTAWKEYYTRETGKNPDEAGVTKEDYERIKKTKMAKGGTVKSQTKRLLAKGGLKHEGGTKDPVSGNNVPTGAMQEEVRDDIPAQLSEGEFVFPADVVRYIGLERLMMMRQAAKKGLMKMEDMGQMSNGDEGDEEEDTAEFESQIDEIIGVLGGREKGEMEEDDEEENPRKMAEGGMPMPAPAAPMPAPAAPMPQTKQAIPMSAPAPAPMAAEAPEQGIASEIDLPQRVESKPTEGLKSSDIIRNNLSAEATPEQTEMFLKQIAMLETASKALSIRHNDTVVIGFVKDKGVVDPIVFSENEPKEFDQAINVAMDAFKKAGVTRLESSSPDKMIIEYLTSKGFPVEEGTPESGYTWALDL